MGKKSHSNRHLSRAAKSSKRFGGGVHKGGGGGGGGGGGFVVATAAHILQAAAASGSAAPAASGGGGRIGGYVSRKASQLQLLHSSNPNPKEAGLYKGSHEILVVGDGNFSFSLALARDCGGQRLIATSFDDEALVRTKYESAGDNLAGLFSTGATVHHEVDARTLHMDERFARRRFDRIVFNFPHVGGSSAEDVAENQRLISDFFLSAAPLLKKKDGQIHVTLRDSSFYRSWGVPQLAHGVNLAHRETRAFDSDAYIGYEATRTTPSASGMRIAPATEGAVVYIVARPKAWAVPKSLTEGPAPGAPTPPADRGDGGRGKLKSKSKRKAGADFEGGHAVARAAAVRRPKKTEANVTKYRRR